MFSDDLKRYARETFLWASFWIIAAVAGFFGWTYGVFAIGGELIPRGPERIPLVIAYFTGLAIFGTTYILTYNRWLKERKETARAIKAAPPRSSGRSVV